MGCSITKTKDRFIHKISTKVKQGENPQAIIVDTKNEENQIITRNQLVLRRFSNITSSYSLGVKIGGGVYGDVRIAEHIITRQKRVIKNIKKSRIRSQEEKIKFLNELEVLQTLDHPNIVKLYEFYEDESNFFLVTEYLAGGELFEYIVSKQYLSEPIAAHFFNQILSALDYIHSKGIIHRDLKPQNLILDSESDRSILKIIDFDTSIRIHTDQFLIHGTSLMYTAPEILKNSNFNQKSDMWSLGVILYILISGSQPFYSDSEKETENLIISGKFNFCAPQWEYISSHCKNLIKNLLNANPDKRMSASEALNSSWIKKFANRRCSTELNQISLFNLKSFFNGTKLQYIFLSFIANHLLNKEETIKLYEKFKALDKNCDGKLSQDELAEAYLSIKKKEDADEEARNIIKQVDVNNSGYIDYAEFVTACAKKEMLLCQKNLENAFKTFDLDENGKLTLDEMAQILGNGVIDEENIKKLLVQMDLNNDGEVDFNEFKIAMKSCFASI